MNLRDNDAPTPSLSRKYTRRYSTIICEKCGKEFKYSHQCEYVCECGRCFTKLQSYVAHCGHCRIHLGHEPTDNFGESRSWASGKTKETDERIMRMSKRQSERTTKSFLEKHHTEETKKIMSEKARITAREHRNGWKSGNNRIPNRFESFAEQFLIDNGISFEKEVVVPQSLLGKKGSYYQLDFLVNNEIDLEIDGSAHDTDHDAVRDQYISKIYKVHRIDHNDSIEKLKLGLSQFIASLRY